VTAGRLVRWADIATIVALELDIYLGKVVCLAIAAKDGTTCYVAEGDPLWQAALEAIATRLDRVLPLEQWLFDVASGRRDFVTIYGPLPETATAAAHRPGEY
jgi:hypothetical protein